MTDKVYGEDIMSDEEVIEILNDIQKGFIDSTPRADGKSTRRTQYIFALARAKKIVEVYHLMTEKELDL